MAWSRLPTLNAIATATGFLLLFWALALAASGGDHEAAPARRAEEGPEMKIVSAEPDPDGSDTVDIVYERDDGSLQRTKIPGEEWRKYEKRHTKHPFIIVSLIIYCIQIAFACFYKSRVVDLIPPLEQRPVSADEDFQQDIFACFGEGQGQLCLHAGFCCGCRAAHTWHVAGVCEYWPALALLFLGHLAKIACCVDAVIYTYFRMKLKEKLGIRPNLCLDLAYSMFCPCCAVGQEAMAVDAELGTQVDCCCQLKSPAAIGSQNPMDRGNLVQLVTPADPTNEDVAEAGE